MMGKGQETRKKRPSLLQPSSSQREIKEQGIKAGYSGRRTRPHAVEFAPPGDQGGILAEGGEG